MKTDATNANQTDLLREQLATLLGVFEDWRAAKDGDVFLLQKVEELIKRDDRKP